MSYEEPTAEELIRSALLKQMEDLCEDLYFAAWLTDWEFSLWDALSANHLNLGFGGTERDLKRLKHLQVLADGWWIWPSDSHEQRFLSTAEWQSIFAEWKSNRSTRADKAPEVWEE